MTTLPVLLRALCLPTFAREYAVVAAHAAREGLSHEAYLQTLATQEASDRAARRVERLIVEAKLPRGKSLATFDLARLPPKVRTAVATLREGPARRWKCSSPSSQNATKRRVCS
jgi:DNA replication protein DnaC